MVLETPTQTHPIAPVPYARPSDPPYGSLPARLFVGGTMTSALLDESTAGGNERHGAAGQAHRSPDDAVPLLRPGGNA